MGLDQYLNRKVYIKNWDHQKTKYEVTVVKINKETGERDEWDVIGRGDVHSITEEVAYWRKSNQIHNWFVQNCQNGEDDCKEYEVSVEQLEELLEHCNEVIKNPENAEVVLPTQGGFFFGSTDYDQYYMDDIKQTKKVLTKIINKHKSIRKKHPDAWVYYSYTSSW